MGYNFYFDTHKFKMSIPFSGSVGLSGGVIAAITKQLRSVNLKAVKRITVKFDPFANNVVHTRDFLYYVSMPKVIATNPSCIIKTEILCNREEPTVSFKLLPAIADSCGTDTVTLKSGNLDCLELFQLCNKYVTPLAPQEQIAVIPKTKSEKKKGKRN